MERDSSSQSWTEGKDRQSAEQRGRTREAVLSDPSTACNLGYGDPWLIASRCPLHNEGIVSIRIPPPATSQPQPVLCACAQVCHSTVLHDMHAAFNRMRTNCMHAAFVCNEKFEK